MSRFVLLIHLLIFTTQWRITKGLAVNGTLTFMCLPFVILRIIYFATRILMVINEPQIKNETQVLHSSDFLIYSWKFIPDEILISSFRFDMKRPVL
jgi:hypothetical protein